MDFESCNPAAQFAIQQSQNSFVIPNATPFIEFDLNVLATGHVGLTIRIFDVTQPLSFAVFNRVQPHLATSLNQKMSFLHQTGLPVTKPYFLLANKCIWGKEYAPFYRMLHSVFHVYWPWWSMSKANGKKSFQSMYHVKWQYAWQGNQKFHSR